MKDVERMSDEQLLEATLDGLPLSGLTIRKQTPDLAQNSRDVTVSHRSTPVWSITSAIARL